MKKSLRLIVVIAFVIDPQIAICQKIMRDSVIQNDVSFILQNRNALKLDVSSFLVDVTSLTYEHYTKPGRSIEGTIGIIGVGIPFDKKENPGGFLLRGGYKIMLNLFPSANVRYKHWKAVAFISHR